MSQRQIIYTFVFILLSFVFTTQAQDLDRPITIKVEGQPLKEVLNQISAQGQIHFSYSTQIIDTEKKITYQANHKPIREVLNEVLVKNGIEWVEVEKHVVLKPMKTVASQKRPLHTISGYIREEANGEALIGANVYVAGTNYGAVTNTYGFYSLSLPPGEHSVVYSFLGYSSETRDLNIEKNLQFSVELEETSLGIKEIIIVAGDHGAVPGIDQLGDFRLSGKTLSKLPGFAGEVDVLKALQTLPGISSFGDGSSFFYVRGGNSDQNLLMIDEAPIYNPSHLFGFFSVLTPDAVNEIKVYKGDFPARYGGRASSVIDITAREGNMKKFSFGGNMGIYASSLTVEGPIVKDKASFIVSGRLSTLNWLSRLVGNNPDFRLYFYDLNAKFNVQVSKNDRFFFTFYAGKDEFKQDISSVYSSFGISWSNLAGTIRWNHIFGPKLFNNLTTNYGDYRYFLYLSADGKDYWGSSIASFTVKDDLSWFINPKNTMRMGAGISSYRSNPGNVNLESSEEGTFLREVPHYRSLEYVLYVSNEQRIGKKLSLNYGIRLPIWRNYGPTTLYYFDANHNVIDTLDVRKDRYYETFVSPEPRVSVSYAFKSSSLKAGYSRMTQFLQLLSNTTGPFTSLEAWVPAGPNIKPLKTDQVSVGYFLDLKKDSWQLSLEGYYKWFTDNMDYTDHANLLFNPLIEGELRFGKSWAYGMELMLRKTYGRFSGWAAYTYSRAFVETPEVNGGEAYPALYDTPHNINLFVSYKTKKRWSFSGNWIFRTGNPVTAPISFYEYDGYTVPLYGEKNNERLPNYHRLDLSMAYRLNKPGNRFKHNLALTLYNFYGRANPFSVSFNKYNDGDDKYLVPGNQDGNYELVPTMISVAGIIPSFNYKFKF